MRRRADNNTGGGKKIQSAYKQYASLVNLFDSSLSASKVQQVDSSLHARPHHMQGGLFRRNTMGTVEEANNTVKEYNQQISVFVEEVTSDPSILNRLIDYGLLADYVGSTVEEQRKRLQELKKIEEQELAKKQRLMGESGKSVFEQLKQQIFDLDEKLVSMQVSEKQLQARHAETKRHFLTKKDSLVREYESRQILQQETINEIKQNIEQYHNQSRKVEKKIQEVSKKLQKFEKKQSKLKQIQQRIKSTSQLVKNKRVELLGLKKVETESLKKYKELMVTKMGVDASLKFNSEKKLKMFVEELRKVLDKGDSEEFYRLTSKHTGIGLNSATGEIYSIRSKNSSSNTQPDEFSETEKSEQLLDSGDSAESQLLSLERQNPGLKANKTMDIATLDGYSKSTQQKISNAHQSIKAFESSIESSKTRVEKLQKEEEDQDSFIGSLKQKLAQIDQELQIAATFSLGMKKNNSTRT